MRWCLSRMINSAPKMPHKLLTAQRQHSDRRANMTEHCVPGDATHPVVWVSVYTYDSRQLQLQDSEIAATYLAATPKIQKYKGSAVHICLKGSTTGSPLHKKPQTALWSQRVVAQADSVYI